MSYLLALVGLFLGCKKLSPDPTCSSGILSCELVTECLFGGFKSAYSFMSSLALFSFPTSKELFSHLVREDLCSFSWGFPLNLFMDQAADAAKSLQSCPTLCDPIDGSPPGSPVLGILQARTLEWVAISFSNAWKWKVKVKSLSCVWLLATPWTVAFQAPPSMGFSRQEYWSGLPLPSLHK